jgi:cardiolipin synthase
LFLVIAIGSLAAVVVPLFHLLGVVCGARAVYASRSPQGAIAWALALALFPYLAVPAYFVFGRSKFRHYVTARRAEDIVRAAVPDEAEGRTAAVRSNLEKDSGGALLALDHLARTPFTRGNHVGLLVDGQATFDAIFEAVDAAERYILIQFYIVRDDGLGRALRDRLAAKARAGVKVYFLYDEIGSSALSESYCEEARGAGIEIVSFHTTQGRANRFQLNFRNHRKIVVVDGRVAFVGGHNVGDEYLGQDPKFGAWRDTHVRIEGPMVTGAQLAFAEDWRWRTKSVPEVLDWTPEVSARGEMNGVVLPSGPADVQETCGLMFAHLIHSAKSRVWLATPYFVPDDATVAALRLAVMRGVDVRLIVPKNNDSMLVELGALNYVDQVRDAGASVFRYRDGFMHQKVALIDEIGSCIGTANMDNRSYRLNFEISAIVVDRGFAREMEAMFERDFSRCEPVGERDFEDLPVHVKLGAKIARLFSPIL